MVDPHETSSGTLSVSSVAVFSLLAGGLVLATLIGNTAAWMFSLGVIVTDGGMAVAVLLAAGGWGYLLLRRLAPAGSPTPLRVFTAVGLGLWLLSLAVLLVGSFTHGLLRPWIWWPVIAAGIALAAIQGRQKLEAWRLPRKADGRILVWILLAAAIGVWLAGATRPPGVWYGLTDEYDVLEYHLQVPREFFDGQHVGELPHNCYSYYPLGVEMLFLLSMALRNGAYEGMYLAKMMHGAFILLAAVAVFTTLRPKSESRARFATGLLVTAPFVLYLSWLAMEELAELAYLMLALLWLRQWIATRDGRSALCLGLMVGAACGTKYLSVGLIAAPLAVAMIVLVLLKREREDGARAPVAAGVAQWILAGLAALALFSPWLIRNAAYTGNPVFPLETQLFGRGHWSAESEQRWLAGHGPEVKPPVPVPPGWRQGEPQPSRAEMLYRNLIAYENSHWFGTLMMALAGAALLLLIVRPGRGEPWDFALGVVLILQVVIWAWTTHEMPPRFITPAIVPMALLAGGLLSRLSGVRANPFARGEAQPAMGPWGLGPAVAIFMAAAVINLLTAISIYTFHSQGGYAALNGQAGEQIARYFDWKPAWDLPPGSRLMVVGDATAFYFPSGTVYATVFDAQPLARMVEDGLTPAEILARLRAMGVTHLWFNWPEIGRLAGTYGFPAALSRDLFLRARQGEPPGLPVLDELAACGMTVWKEIRPPAPASEPSSQASSPDSSPASAPAGRGAAWPVVTIYALPPGK